MGGGKGGEGDGGRVRRTTEKVDTETKAIA